MSVWDLLAVLRRQIVVVVVCLIATMLAAVWAVRTRGVYSASASVGFVLPASAANPNPLVTSSRSLIDMAGLVATKMDPGGGQLRTSSQDVPLSGAGVLDGYAVRQFDAGQQWNHNFDRPEIRIQVTGPTVEIVEKRMADLLTEVDTVLVDLQDQQGVAPESRIVARRDSEPPAVYWETGSKVRALGMTLLLGMGMTIAMAVFFDSRRVRGGFRRRSDLRTGAGLPCT